MKSNDYKKNLVNLFSSIKRNIKDLQDNTPQIFYKKKKGSRKSKENTRKKVKRRTFKQNRLIKKSSRNIKKNYKPKYKIIYRIKKSAPRKYYNKCRKIVKRRFHNSKNTKRLNETENLAIGQNTQFKFVDPKKELIKLNEKEEQIKKELVEIEKELSTADKIQVISSGIKSEIKTDLVIFEQRLFEIESCAKDIIEKTVDTIKDEINHELVNLEKNVVVAEDLVSTRTDKLKQELVNFNLAPMQEQVQERVPENYIRHNEEIDRFKKEIHTKHIKTKINDEVGGFGDSLHLLSNKFKNLIENKLGNIKDELAYEVNKVEDSAVKLKDTIKEVIDSKAEKVKKDFDNLQIKNKLKEEASKLSQNISEKIHKVAVEQPHEIVEKVHTHHIEHKKGSHSFTEQFKNEIKEEVHKFEDEVNKVGSNIKHIFAPKHKDKASDKEDLRITAIEKIATIKPGKDLREAFEDFSWDLKVFLQHYFGIKYEFTAEELKQELESKKVDTKISDVLIYLFDFIEKVRFKDYQLTQQNLNEKIKNAITIIRIMKD